MKEVRSGRGFYWWRGFCEISHESAKSGIALLSQERTEKGKGELLSWGVGGGYRFDYVELNLSRVCPYKYRQILETKFIHEPPHSCFEPESTGDQKYNTDMARKPSRRVTTYSISSSMLPLNQSNEDIRLPSARCSELVGS